MKRNWEDAAFRLRKNRLIRAVGVPAYRVGRKLRETPGPSVLVNSFPKSGTHLVMEAMSTAFGLPFSGLHIDDTSGRSPQARSLDRTPTGTYSTSHLVFDAHFARFLAESRFVVVHVDRDPIAALLSLLSYVPTRPHDAWAVVLGEAIADPNELANAVLEGSVNPAVFHRPFAEEYERFLGWRSQKEVLSIAYESLVGPDGPQVLQKMAALTGLSLDSSPSLVMETLIGTRTATSSKAKIELAALDPSVIARVERELLPLRAKRQELLRAVDAREGGTS